MKRNGGRGGARAGAGRKRKEGRVCPVAVRVTERAKSNLEAYAEARGISMADALTALLEGLDV